MKTYDDAFFERLARDSHETAKAIVPLVLELTRAESVIDLGCGVGSWLSVFREHGVGDVLGVDRSYVSRDRLDIPPENFVAFDLREPFPVERAYDLAMSLEVAEHLPESCADQFVSTLCELAPCVLFSAAIPHQGGTRHVNEQWPQYWAERFDRHGYAVADCIRWEIWSDPTVSACIAQNTLLYVRRDCLDDNTALADAVARTDLRQLAVVHPGRYQLAADPAHMSLTDTLALLPAVARSAWARRRQR